MRTLYIGIDPGFGGAVGVIDDNGFVAVHDTPSIETKSGKKTRRKYNVPEMVKIIDSTFCPSKTVEEVSEAAGTRVVCALEAVGSMPGQGVASMFAFGRGLGTWEGILNCMYVTTFTGGCILMVRPQLWKSVMLEGMDKSSKASSILKATQLFPLAPISLKKHDGRAEALLIAEWARRHSSSSGNGSSSSGSDSVTD